MSGCPWATRSQELIADEARGFFGTTALPFHPLRAAPEPGIYRPRDLLRVTIHLAIALEWECVGKQGHIVFVGFCSCCPTEKGVA